MQRTFRVAVPMTNSSILSSEFEVMKGSKVDSGMDKLVYRWLLFSCSGLRILAG